MLLIQDAGYCSFLSLTKLGIKMPRQNLFLWASSRCLWPFISGFIVWSLERVSGVQVKVIMAGLLAACDKDGNSCFMERIWAFPRSLARRWLSLMKLITLRGILVILKYSSHAGTSKLALSFLLLELHYNTSQDARVRQRNRLPSTPRRRPSTSSKFIFLLGRERIQWIVPCHF